MLHKGLLTVNKEQQYSVIQMYCTPGTGLGLGLTGKPSRAWVGAWVVGAWVVGAWLDIWWGVLYCCQGSLFNSYLLLKNMRQIHRLY